MDVGMTKGLHSAPQPASGTLAEHERQGNETFMDAFRSYCLHVDRELKVADQKVAEFAVGNRHDIHEIMIATEKAALSFSLLMKIRNKLLEAYQEVMRMQF
jgi:flagellar hook-basal body complex protein FliE